MQKLLRNCIFVTYHILTAKTTQRAAGINININNQIFRQLKVGLFEKEPHEHKRIFTGKNSAIDMWTIDDHELTIYELKTYNSDSMEGIITEALFYGNYCRDLFMSEEEYPFTPSKKNLKANKRGYEVIYNALPITKVNVILLADNIEKFYPFVADAKVIDLLNSGKNKAVQYATCLYNMTVVETDKKNKPKKVRL